MKWSERFLQRIACSINVIAPGLGPPLIDRSLDHEQVKEIPVTGFRSHRIRPQQGILRRQIDENVVERICISAVGALRNCLSTKEQQQIDG